MSPYEIARDCDPAGRHSTFRVEVEGRPYLPFRDVDPGDHEAIKKIVVDLVEVQTPPTKEGIEVEDLLSVEVVKGGNTNELFCVRGLGSCSCRRSNASQVPPPNAVLVRIFGAHGLIDRDEESTIFAALADQGFAPRFHGRFANGRIEEFLEGVRPLTPRELSSPAFSSQIARKLGSLHQNFKLPESLARTATDPTMWTQLDDWLLQSVDQAKAVESERQERLRAANLRLNELRNEVENHKESLLSSSCTIAYCHNDVLAANILVDNEGSLHFVDFEYGGTNYAAFDIANHFNEFAGGTDHGVPNYEWFPSEEQQRQFCAEYLGTDVCDERTGELLSQVKLFVLVNHLYWGLWAINLGTKSDFVLEEGGFDYLLYGGHRIGQYWRQRQQVRSE